MVKALRISQILSCCLDSCKPFLSTKKMTQKNIMNKTHQMKVTSFYPFVGTKPPKLCI